MMQMFREVEAATTMLEWHGLGLTFTAPGMMMKHWTPDEISPELKSVAMQLSNRTCIGARAAQESTEPGKPYVQYWIGRLKFGIGYMDAIEAVHAGASAKTTGDRTQAASEASRALALSTERLESYAGVARDRSDKGAIAVMNEYVYRPLRAKLVDLKKNQHSAKQPAVRATNFQVDQGLSIETTAEPYVVGRRCFLPKAGGGTWAARKLRRPIRRSRELANNTFTK